MTASLGVPVTLRQWGYRHASRAAFAVRNLDLEIPAGQKVLLLGASGVGKSTLLQAIGGLLGAAGDGGLDDDGGVTEGQILVDGIPAAAARAHSALMMQDPEAQAILQTVGDNVAFGLENLGVAREEIWPRVTQALERVGLGQMERHRSTAHVSGGQMQRIALAGALAMQPGLLLLDEPTANLDPEGTTEIATAIHALADATDMTMIVVEHRTDIWADLVDRVVVVGRSASGETQVVADGMPDDVFSDTTIDFASLGIWVPGAQVPRLREQAGKSVAQEAVSAAPLLTCHNLAFGRDTPLGQNADFTVTAGEITAIVGPNGAGKSTFALTLAGLLPPLGGSLSASDALKSGLADSDPNRWSSRDLASRIQYVFQNPEHQFTRSTVLDEVMLGSTRTGVTPEAARTHAMDLLQRFNLDQYARANPYTLSGGEKRRLTVAAALAAAPKILILDEPTFGQDRATWQEMATLMVDLADSGVAIVVVTHDEALVTALGARVVHLSPAESSEIRVSDVEARAEAERPTSRSPLIASLNPAIRLLGGFVVGLPLLFSLDVVSAAVALGLEVLLFWVVGIHPGRLVKSSWPVFVAAPGSALAVVLYGKPSGAVFFDWGMIHVTEGSVTLAAATFLRALAIGVPAIVMILGVDVTRLADSFSMVFHLPDRFVYGGLAGMRLFAVVRDDWAALTASRRSRGLGDNNKLLAFFPQAFALLVLSIRRSASLAVAMEARGFGAETGRPRTHARTSPVRARDWLFVVGCLTVPLFALGAAIAFGSFAFLGDLIDET